MPIIYLFCLKLAKLQEFQVFERKPVDTLQVFEILIIISGCYL